MSKNKRRGYKKTKCEAFVFKSTGKVVMLAPEVINFLEEIKRK